MAVTRLKRKRLKNKVRSAWRKNVLKHLLFKPTLKKEEGNAALEQISAETQQK